MDIQVERFREVLRLLKPAIPRKTTLPVLTYVVLKDGKAVATDLDTMVIVQVPEADVDCLVPYADVVDMLQYVQGLEYLHIEPTDGKVTMSWSDGSASFDTKDPEDFPLIPEFVPVAEAPMDMDTLIPAMCEALAFAARETDRPVLNGVTMVMGESVSVAAGDGFRMAYKTLPLSFPQERIFVVPVGAVNALKLLWDKTPRTPPVSDALIPAIMFKKQASVALDDDRGLRFVFGDSTTAIVKLVQGDPPAWLKLMPKGEPVLRALVMGPQLALAVRRVLRIAMAGSKIVRMVFDDDTATISAKHENQEIQSTLKVLELQGAPGKVGLDATYLLDYLKGKEGIVSLSWVSEGSPIAFKHQNGPTVLIMPMVVDWGDKPVVADEPEAELEEELEAEADISEEPTEIVSEETAAEVEEKTEPVAAAPTETPAKRKRKR